MSSSCNRKSSSPSRGIDVPSLSESPSSDLSACPLRRPTVPAIFPSVPGPGSDDESGSELLWENDIGHGSWVLDAGDDAGDGVDRADDGTSVSSEEDENHDD